MDSLDIALIILTSCFLVIVVSEMASRFVAVIMDKRSKHKEELARIEADLEYRAALLHYEKRDKSLTKEKRL